VDSQHGFIGEGCGRGTSTVLETHDGGRTWKEGVLGVAADAYGDVPAPTFTSDVDGYTTAEPFGGSGTRLLVTHDAGRTWRTFALPEDSTGLVAFGGAVDAVVVGRSGRVYATHDRGLSWTALGSTLDPSVVLNFVDKAHGFAADPLGQAGPLYATSDGGASWTMLVAQLVT
jgi:photosystem II stability/assembly factor-like uncharacterized protein